LNSSAAEQAAERRPHPVLARFERMAGDAVLEQRFALDGILGARRRMSRHAAGDRQQHDET
jgi:hypothetical protein